MAASEKAGRRLTLAAWVLVGVGALWLASGLVGVAGCSCGGGAVAVLAGVALGVTGSARLRGFAFTAWVLVCAGSALVWPQAFQAWGGFRLTGLIVPLIQVIMFGMGTTLSPGDFSRVLLRPWPVLTGVALQFGVMPLLGCLIAGAFGFTGELGAGIVLIGSVSGGAASNVVAYIAGADVALSVTMTAVSTLAAPLATPVLMRLLAGRFVPVDAAGMTVGILGMIAVPVAAGLFAHRMLYGRGAWAWRGGPLAAVAGCAAAAAVAARFVGCSPALVPLRDGVSLGLGLIACVAAAKGVVSVGLGRPNTWMERLLPRVSMGGICLILLVVVAMTRDVFMSVGPLLVAAALVHNLSGYALGYWCARGLGAAVGRAGYRLGLRATRAPAVDEAACRTVAIEVGMQNGGMGAALALQVLHSPTAALPSNVFGTVMNLTGSVLANWWKRKPILDGDANRSR